MKILHTKEEKPIVVTKISETQIAFTIDGQEFCHTMPENLSEVLRFDKLSIGSQYTARWFKGKEVDYSDSLFFDFKPLT